MRTNSRQRAWAAYREIFLEAPPGTKPRQEELGAGYDKIKAAVAIREAAQASEREAGPVQIFLARLAFHAENIYHSIRRSIEDQKPYHQPRSQA